jgi:GNAT superfamily N-acetyltransferase
LYPAVVIRPAAPADVPAILQLIKELAEYERAPDAVEATDELLRNALFCAEPRVHVHIAEQDGAAVGFAMWFVNFSTWLGRHGIYLEDLYVKPAYRGQGHGMALLTELARICVERGYGRLEWWVLDWNEPAIGFYRSIGAIPMSEWTVQRLSGDALTALAARVSQSKPAAAARRSGG